MKQSNEFRNDDSGSKSKAKWRLFFNFLNGWGARISNSQMMFWKSAFEIWPEFPLISERSATGDFPDRVAENDAHPPAAITV
jgi:hypothetical protein